MHTNKRVLYVAKQQLRDWSNHGLYSAGLFACLILLIIVVFATDTGTWNSFHEGISVNLRSMAWHR